MNTRDTYAGEYPVSRAPSSHRGASAQFLSAQEIVSAPFKLSEIRELLLDVFLIGSALLFVAGGPLAAAGAAAVYIITRR